LLVNKRCLLAFSLLSRAGALTTNWCPGPTQPMNTGPPTTPTTAEYAPANRRELDLSRAPTQGWQPRRALRDGLAAAGAGAVGG
jgi:hypothetical protein